MNWLFYQVKQSPLQKTLPGEFGANKFSVVVLAKVMVNVQQFGWVSKVFHSWQEHICRGASEFSHLLSCSLLSLNQWYDFWWQISVRSLAQSGLKARQVWCHPQIRWCPLLGPSCWLEPGSGTGSEQSPGTPLPWMRQEACETLNTSDGQKLRSFVKVARKIRQSCSSHSIELLSKMEWDLPIELPLNGPNWHHRQSWRQPPW